MYRPAEKTQLLSLVLAAIPEGGTRAPTQEQGATTARSQAATTRSWSCRGAKLREGLATPLLSQEKGVRRYTRGIKGRIRFKAKLGKQIQPV
jgi:hypothetical protein